MYCSHCGKKVGDTMLFCPFCGEAIVIPDQDDGSREAQQVDSAEIDAFEPLAVPAAEPAREPETTAEAVEETDAAAELEDWSRAREEKRADDVWARRDAPEEPFTPLVLDGEDEAPANWREEIASRKQAVTVENKPPEIRREDDQPVRLEGSAPDLNLEVEGAKGAPREKAPRKHANTLVPPKTMNPNDIFMDDKSPAFDAVDPYDDVGNEDFSGAFAFEDDDEGSFFMRHLRGIVGLALFVILILMFVIYAFSRAGQFSLARFNLAWSTDAYSSLGYQSYQEERYSDAGLYYERALQRDPGNYSFASSAAMAYFEAKNTEKSAEMLKKCIDINPALLEPYIYLLKLYPEAAQRPWDVTQLLQQGYRQTGDARLNVTG